MTALAPLGTCPWLGLKNLLSIYPARLPLRLVPGGHGKARKRVMTISIEQAIEIHAKSAISLGGNRAEKSTRERAEHCKTRGDTDGYETWTKVADTIRHLNQSGYKARRIFR